MTGDQVASVLGAPNIVTSNAGGGETWVWDKISTERAYSQSSGGVNALFLAGRRLRRRGKFDEPAHLDGDREVRSAGPRRGLQLPSVVVLMPAHAFDGSPRARGERRALVLGLGAAMLLSACQTTSAQQAAALTPSSGAVAARARQSRRFDTEDRDLMMRAALGALQDLGFSIDESDEKMGVLVGSKLAGGKIRAQVTARPLPGGSGTLMRATFQRVIARPGAMLSYGETLDDPQLYQVFFEKVAQSAFLTAHEI